MTASWDHIKEKDIVYYRLDVPGVIILYSTRKGNTLFLEKFRPVLQKQVHGNCINNIDETAPGTGDGMVSRQMNEYLGIKVADCLPVFLFNDQKICAIHCGWRGIANGIVQAAKEIMSEYKYAFGASIGPCCYEIKSDVEKKFSSHASEVIQKRNGRIFLDLKLAVRNILGADKLIADLVMCTKCRNDIFYSYRAGDTDQRNCAAICKE